MFYENFYRPIVSIWVAVSFDRRNKTAEKNIHSFYIVSHVSKLRDVHKVSCRLKLSWRGKFLDHCKVLITSASRIDVHDPTVCEKVSVLSIPIKQFDDEFKKFCHWINFHNLNRYRLDDVGAIKIAEAECHGSPYFGAAAN